MPRDSFERQVRELKTGLLDLGAIVERTIRDGVEALKTRDRVMAEALIAHDAEINRLRYQLEEQSYELMATQQPLASDLREIISILLIAIELERIADHSKNLGEIVIHMGNEPLLKPLIDIPRMADLCQEMLRQALDAFARNDAEAGRAVRLKRQELPAIRVLAQSLDQVPMVWEPLPGVIRVHRHQPHRNVLQVILDVGRLVEPHPVPEARPAHSCQHLRRAQDNVAGTPLQQGHFRNEGALPCGVG